MVIRKVLRRTLSPCFVADRLEEPMLGSRPPFPAFDEWEKMSESEHDALIARIDAVGQRNSRIYRILVWAIPAAAISAVLYVASTLR